MSSELDPEDLTHSELFEIVWGSRGGAAVPADAGRVRAIANGAADEEDEPVRPLTNEQRARLDRFYQEYLNDLVQAALSQLRVEAREAAPGLSAVVHSAFASFMDHHIDHFDLRDDGVLWLTLIEATLRHCEKWNQRCRRHPSGSLDSGASGKDSDNGTRGHDPAGRPAVSPESEALKRLLQTLEGELTPIERGVLVGKLRRKRRPEIAADLNITLYEVDAAWKSIQEKAARVGRRAAE